MAIKVLPEELSRDAERLARFEHDWMQRGWSFDVAGDGRFIMIRDETPPATSIEVVLNWAQQLEAVR